MVIGKARWQAVVLLLALALASCTAAHASVQPGAPGIDALSSGRIAAIVAALAGLTSAVIGGLALTRAARRVPVGRRRASAAIVMGLLGTALGGLVVATAAGGVGTGNGVGGAVVAMVVGLLGVVLGGLALARSRRTS
jgi:hypothetical protein